MYLQLIKSLRKTTGILIVCLEVKSRQTEKRTVCPGTTEKKNGEGIALYIETKMY